MITRLKITFFLMITTNFFVPFKEHLKMNFYPASTYGSKFHGKYYVNLIFRLTSIQQIILFKVPTGYGRYCFFFECIGPTNIIIRPGDYCRSQEGQTVHTKTRSYILSKLFESRKRFSTSTYWFRTALGPTFRL